MHLSPFVVSGRIFLKTLHDFLIRNLDRMAVFLSRYNKLEDIQQLARVATGVTDEGSRFTEDDVFFFEDDIVRNGAIQKRQQVVFVQWFEYVDLTSRKERADHLERRILRRGADQCDDPRLDRVQK